jgi:hypothetical protein
MSPLSLTRKPKKELESNAFLTATISCGVKVPLSAYGLRTIVNLL